MRMRQCGWAMLLVLAAQSLCLGQATPTSPNEPAAQARKQHIVTFAAMLYYEEAQVHLKAGQTAAAIERLKKAVTESPDFFNALYQLANELYKQKDFQTALDYLEKARQAADFDARPYRLFGLMMMEQNKFKTAETALRNALTRDKNFANTYQALGTTLIAQAQEETDEQKRLPLLAEAEQLLRQSLQLSQDKLTLSHLQLARVYEMRGAKLQALAELNTLLAKSPSAASLPAVQAIRQRLKP